MLKKFSWRTIKIAGVGLAVGWIFGSVLRASQDDPKKFEMPAGKGVEILNEKCLLCHEADLIIQQRLTRPAWGREVEKMVRWGTDLKPEEKELLVDYLANHFHPQSGQSQNSSQPAGEAGLTVFKEKCLLCHEADLTEQQRLSRPAWGREVDKMIRWGADVGEKEKDPLVDYLSNHFGPNRDSKDK